MRGTCQPMTIEIQVIKIFNIIFHDKEGYYFPEI
jgi:hypothetical protein